MSPWRIQKLMVCICPLDHLRRPISSGNKSNRWVEAWLSSIWNVIEIVVRLVYHSFCLGPWAPIWSAWRITSGFLLIQCSPFFLWGWWIICSWYEIHILWVLSRHVLTAVRDMIYIIVGLVLDTFCPEPWAWYWGARWVISTIQAFSSLSETWIIVLLIKFWVLNVFRGIISPNFNTVVITSWWWIWWWRGLGWSWNISKWFREFIESFLTTIRRMVMIIHPIKPNSWSIPWISPCWWASWIILCDAMCMSIVPMFSLPCWPGLCFWAELYKLLLVVKASSWLLVFNNLPENLWTKMDCFGRWKQKSDGY